MLQLSVIFKTKQLFSLHRLSISIPDKNVFTGPYSKVHRVELYLNFL